MSQDTKNTDNMKGTESTASFPHVDEYEKRINNGLKQLTSYIYNEPAIVLTILYLSISIIGISYLAIVLFAFDINVLPHVELSDFVLSAIHYPKTLMVFLAFFIFLIVTFKLEEIGRKNWMFYRKLVDKYHKKHKSKHPVLFIGVVVIIYLFVAANLEGVNTIRSLKKGNQPLFSIQLASAITFNDKKLDTLNDVQIVANLSKHLWLYQQNSEQIFMIAHENVLMLTPKLQNKIIDKETPISNKKQPSTDKLPASNQHNKEQGNG